MTIRDIGPGLSKPEGPRRLQDKEESAERAAEPSRGSEGRGDRVEISEAGRVLSSRASPLNELLSIQTSERLAQIQERIDSGAYDTPEMAEEVARRLLDSGDL